MRTDIPALLLQHFQQDSSTLALLWAIERKDGIFLRGTEHDDDINLIGGVNYTDPELAGLYSTNASITASDITSNSDMSVDNAEAEGIIQQPATVITDLTVRDIEGGLLDMAPVWVIACNWRDPSMGHVILRTGYLGEISRDSDGRYRTEVRGLVQLLQQSILDTYGERCNVKRLGDHRCNPPPLNDGVDIDALTETVTVTSVESRRRFHVTDISGFDEQWFGGGIIRGLSGDNVAIEREVKRDNRLGDHGFIDLWTQFPLDVAPGDTFELEPGCDRTITTCREKFGNVRNIQAYGVLIPGVLELLKGPT